MTQPDTTIEADDSAPSHAQPNATSGGRIRWLRELIILAVALGVGIVVLPALIYEFGIVELGPYDGGVKTVWSFFGAYFRNLGDGVFRTWFLVVSPYLYLLLLRLIFISWKRRAAPPETAASADTPSSGNSAAVPDANRRREPFVGS